MDTEHEGLPVQGYKPQSSRNVALVDEHKIMEEHIVRRCEEIGAMDDMDPRMAALAKTKIQEAFMWLNRAVFQPGRLKLPEDVDTNPMAADEAGGRKDLKSKLGWPDA